MFFYFPFLLLFSSLVDFHPPSSSFYPRPVACLPLKPLYICCLCFYSIFQFLPFIPFFRLFPLFPFVFLPPFPPLFPHVPQSGSASSFSDFTVRLGSHFFFNAIFHASPGRGCSFGKRVDGGGLKTMFWAVGLL
ncbi:hypothetical protein DVH24_010761 [Malus domestica]|uniref:Uncharacterized protein n=1 Tax=Malus domestica TaxID=3750 RepID=A0A498JTR2_MALDO|nr:hypothetical protein DVH24_010761 [Malus domestica]